MPEGIWRNVLLVGVGVGVGVGLGAGVDIVAVVMGLLEDYQSTRVHLRESMPLTTIIVAKGRHLGKGRWLKSFQCLNV